MTLSSVANLGRSRRRSSAGDLKGCAAFPFLKEGAASDSGVMLPNEAVEASSAFFSLSMDEESRVPSLLVLSDCVSWCSLVDVKLV
jgi:hypothetical protein